MSVPFIIYFQVKCRNGAAPVSAFAYLYYFSVLHAIYRTCLFRFYIQGLLSLKTVTEYLLRKDLPVYVAVLFVANCTPLRKNIKSMYHIKNSNKIL